MVTRRDVLRFAGSSLALAGGGLPGRSLAQGGRRIDIHHHWHPPPIDWAFQNTGIGASWTGDGLWNVNGAISLLDRFEIDTAVLSVRNPRLRVPVPACREVNELAARIVGDHPARFGAFALLPQFDVDASVDELVYALDTLGLHGVLLHASVDNHYLGSPTHELLMAELNERSAVVLMHPTAPSYFQELNLNLAPSVIEYVFETTRAIANLVVSGTLDRYPRVRFIAPHAGGTVPYIAERLAEQAARANPSLAERPRSIIESLKTFYFGTAQATSVQALNALLSLVDTSKIIFGTDLPISSPSLVRDSQAVLDGYDALSAGDRERIESGNAMDLFPRLG